MELRCGHAKLQGPTLFQKSADRNGHVGPPPQTYVKVVALVVIAPASSSSSSRRSSSLAIRTHNRQQAVCPRPVALRYDHGPLTPSFSFFLFLIDTSPPLCLSLPLSTKQNHPSMAPKRTARTAPAPRRDDLSPERFETELRSLAAKAKSQSWARETAARLSPYVVSLALLTLVSVYSNASQMALSPVYGSLPSAAWHAKLTAAACFVGWAANVLIEGKLPVPPLKLIPVVAAYVPVVQFFLCRYSDILTARWGPLVTELATLAPLIVLTASCVASNLEGVRLGSLPSFVADSAPGLGSLLYFKLAEGVSGALLSRHVGRTIFLTRIGLEMLLAGIYAVLAPSKLLLLSLPAILHTAVFNHHLHTPSATAALQTALGAQNWTLLDRKESVTGYISVLQSAEHGFRVLRADHSLLGGEWVRFPGPIVAEPVYSVFVMLEAVRLVDAPQPIVDGEADALVM